MHDLIASPFLDDHLLLRPGHRSGVRLPRGRFEELAADNDATLPAWVRDVARRTWGLYLDGQSTASTILVRRRSTYGYGRASYELNLGCNYDCEHCYLGLKRFEGLSWPDRERLLYTLRDAGVLWLQLTGGELMIDKLFAATHELAYRLGMMISISTNGSRLWHPAMIELLSTYRPYRITVSVYGPTAESYDALTRRRGSFKAFHRGLLAAHEAGLPLNLNLIIARQNAHEVDQMIAMAEDLGLPHHEFSNMSPTIYGGAESLPAQSLEHQRKRKVFTGCNAGHTFFHVDPHARVSICKVGRDDQINLLDEGLSGLDRLGGIADKLMLRTGGCAGCALSGSCMVCRPLAKLYQEAKAPLSAYCQHGQR